MGLRCMYCVISFSFTESFSRYIITRHCAMMLPTTTSHMSHENGFSHSHSLSLTSSTGCVGRGPNTWRAGAWSPAAPAGRARAQQGTALCLPETSMADKGPRISCTAAVER